MANDAGIRVRVNGAWHNVTEIKVKTGLGWRTIKYASKPASGSTTSIRTKTGLGWKTIYK